MAADFEDLMTRYMKWNYSQHGTNEPATDSSGNSVMKANQSRKSDTTDPYRNTIWYLPGAYNPSTGSRVITLDDGINQLFIAVAMSHGIETELNDSTGSVQDRKDKLQDYVKCIDNSWTSVGLTIEDPDGNVTHPNVSKPVMSDFIDVHLNDGDQYLTSINQHGPYDGLMLTYGHVYLLDVRQGNWKISFGCTAPSSLKKCGKAADIRYTINLTYNVAVPVPRGP